MPCCPLQEGGRLADGILDGLGGSDLVGLGFLPLPPAG